MLKLEEDAFMSKIIGAVEDARMNAHMTGLVQHRNTIYQLQSVWDNLSLLAQLSGTGTDMTQTRVAFGQVTNDVLDNLFKETLNKTVATLSSKAFVIINILVRNLFERTADIGFLATDDDIRYFLTKHHETTASELDSKKLQLRFDEYIKKYSVYSNIIVLDTQGNVLVQHDLNNPVTHSKDALVKDALSTDQAYIEIYRKTDLLPNQDKSLIYAYRITSADSSKALGVLCLCFRFENEMESVFKNLIKSDDWAIGVMLDQDNQVIASSDAFQIPLGANLETTENGEDWIVTRFAGREYLAVSRSSAGFQGYMGPGWKGHAMIPLEHAFNQDSYELVRSVNKEMLAKVMRSPLIFSQSLLGIPKKAASIQSRLNQSVWNGNIWQSKEKELHQNKFSKTLLWEVSNTGFKTQTFIEKTVSDLYQTVVSIMLEDSRFFAFLGVDIMDRNLYERANDCRWWALTYSFRKLLSKTQRTKQDNERIEKILKYINGLYTVYENLVIFDRQGMVVAVSNAKYRDYVGNHLEGDFVSGVRTLQSSQEYIVSKFQPSVLYDNQYTYIYAAAIHSLDNTSVVGGIGLVFDSKSQFEAILNDVLPRNNKGEIIKDSFTLFIDDNLKIISSTSDAFKVGCDFKIPLNLCKLEAGESGFDIAEYNDCYYAVGACASSGYREYKGEHDRYKNAITALIFTPLGDANEINQLIEADLSLQHNQFKPSTAAVVSEDSEEFATFYVSKRWYGIPASQVVEATEPINIRHMPDSQPFLEGMFKYEEDIIPVINLANLLNTKSKFCDENDQIIIIQPEGNSKKFGILVNALGEIPSISKRKIELFSSVFTNKQEGIIYGFTNPDLIENHSADKPMLTILSAKKLWLSIGSESLQEACV